MIVSIIFEQINRVKIRLFLFNNDRIFAKIYWLENIIIVTLE